MKRTIFEEVVLTTGMFEVPPVPVVNRTENASVAIESNTASVGDYTNAKGKQLLNVYTK